MSQMGVYRLYNLAQKGKGFSETRLGMERDLHVIQNSYAEGINANSAINGLEYEKDEKATKLYLEKKPFKTVKEFTEFEDVKGEEAVDVSKMTREGLIKFAKDNDFKIDVLSKKEVILEAIKDQSQNQ
jgi:hypothetical protein